MGTLFGSENPKDKSKAVRTPEGIESILEHRLQAGFDNLEVAAWDYIVYCHRNGKFEKIEEILKKTPHLKAEYEKLKASNK
jgi:hypothetical protein